MTDVQKTFLRNSHLQESLLRHSDESGKRRGGKISRYHTSSIENGRCAKSQHQLERDFTCEDWSHCLYRRRFKSENWTIFVQSEGHKRILPTRVMNYAKIPFKSTSHLHHKSNIKSLLYYRSWTGNKLKRSERSCTGDVHKTNISLTMRDVQFHLYHGVYKLSRQRCQRSISNYRYKEIKEGESSNSLTT